MAKTHYHPTKLKPLIQIVARLVQKNPALADNPDYLMATLKNSIPTLEDHTTCPNCGASMAEYIFSFLMLDALLLYGMAKIVRAKIRVGIPFTEANKVHIPSARELTYTLKSRTSIASKLGVIAKLNNADGKQVLGTWVITKRGWQALAGEPIPKFVRVFRGQILERTQETITIGEALSLSHKNPEHAEQAAGYSSSEWVTIGGMHQGVLL